jgi:hypothetical protein
LKTGKKEILGVLELGKVVKEKRDKSEDLERKEKEESARTRKEGKGWQGGKDSKDEWRKRRIKLMEMKNFGTGEEVERDLK